MDLKNSLAKIRNIVVAVVLASVAGVGVASIANALPHDDSPARFETNASGQTYGAGDGEVDPDLIRAQGTNGVVGYVLKTDLVGPEMRSPEEVARWLEQYPQDRAREIPLYDVDGKTVLGVFTIAPAQLGDGASK
jgi:hypothetical protein